MRIYIEGMTKSALTMPTSYHDVHVNGNKSMHIPRDRSRVRQKSLCLFIWIIWKTG